MSKSIYEEALNILLNSLQDPQCEDNCCYILNLLEMNVIIKAIQKAQKQEKKHHELFSLYNLLIDNCNDFDLHDDVIVEIKNKIKELENEKEMIK